MTTRPFRRNWPYIYNTNSNQSSLMSDESSDITTKKNKILSRLGHEFYYIGSWIIRRTDESVLINRFSSRVKIEETWHFTEKRYSVSLKYYAELESPGEVTNWNELVPERSAKVERVCRTAPLSVLYRNPYRMPRATKCHVATYQLK